MRSMPVIAPLFFKRQAMELPISPVRGQLGSLVFAKARSIVPGLKVGMADVGRRAGEDLFTQCALLFDELRLLEVAVVAASAARLGLVWCGQAVSTRVVEISEHQRQLVGVHLDGRRSVAKKNIPEGG